MARVNLERLQAGLNTSFEDSQTKLVGFHDIPEGTRNQVVSMITWEARLNKSRWEEVPTALKEHNGELVGFTYLTSPHETLGYALYPVYQVKRRLCMVYKIRNQTRVKEVRAQEVYTFGQVEKPQKANS